MPFTLEDLRSRLQKARPGTVNGCPGVRGCCPHHEDKRPSFYAWHGKDGWLHVRCPSCTEEQLLSALGIQAKDLCQAPRSSPEPDKSYVYHTLDNKPLFRKTRYLDRDGKKNFRLESRQGSTWVKGLEPIGDQRHTLYNLPAVIKAIAKGETIYINEGEKACDLMKEHKLVATCQPFGADKNAGGKWKQQHTQLLNKARVVIVADRDEVGEGYARYVASQLVPVAKSVRVVQSRTTVPKDDAWDHLMAGFTDSDWQERSDLLPQRGLPIKQFHPATFQPVHHDFLVDPYFPQGKCVLLDADGGTGKTSLMVAIAASLSKGIPPPLTSITSITPVTSITPTRTLYLHKGEDQSEELGTVFQANGGDFDGIAFYQGPLSLDEAGIKQIEETVQDGRFDLVVFDAFFYFLFGVVGDTNMALDAIRVMERLTGLAERTGCSIVNIRHTTKGTVGRQASELGMGSVQFRNSHRGQLVARWHPEEPGLVVVTDEKGSLLVPRGPHFCYRRSDLEVQFVHDVPNPFSQAPASSKLDEAEEFLRGYLASGLMPSRACLEEATKRGIGHRTLQKAKQSLGVDSLKEGREWHWFLQEPRMP